MNSHYNIPFPLIKKAIEDEQLDTLYYFFQLRNRFKANIFLTPSIKEVARKCKISPSVLYYHSKKMFENGWIYRTKQGFIALKGINQFKLREKELCVRVPIYKNKKEQIAFFRFVVIKKNLKRQEKAIKHKTEIINSSRTQIPLDKKTLKFMQKNGGFKQIAQSFNNRLTLSNKKIGGLVNRGQTSGLRYQKQLNQMNLIESKRKIEIIKRNCSPLEYFHIYQQKGYTYSRNRGGVVFIQRSNTILIKNPLSNSTVTKVGNER